MVFAEGTAMMKVMLPVAGIVFSGDRTMRLSESRRGCITSIYRVPAGTESIRNRPAASVIADSVVPLTDTMAPWRYPPRTLSTATPVIVAFG